MLGTEHGVKQITYRVHRHGHRGQCEGDQEQLHVSSVIVDRLDLKWEIQELLADKSHKYIMGGMSYHNFFNAYISFVCNLARFSNFDIWMDWRTLRLFVFHFTKKLVGAARDKFCGN